MAGFQFTDDDEPQPQSPPQPAKPASPPPPAGAKPAPPPRPAAPQPPAGAPRPVQPPKPVGQRPTPPVPPAAGGKPVSRHVPKYGEGGVVQEQNPQVQIPLPQQAQEAAVELQRDKTGEALYEMGRMVRSVLDSMEPIASWALRLACGIGALCLAYMLVLYFGGALRDLGRNPNAVVITKNFTLAARGFAVSLVVAYVTSLILGYEDNKLGAIGAALGAVLHFGVPLGIRAIMDPNLQVTAAVAAQFRSIGLILLVVGLARASMDVVVWLVTLPDRIKQRADVGFAHPAEAKQQAVAREANMFSPCWKLPFCRETIRKQCPAFLANKTCWKFGRGCYCDEEMIGRIIRGESLDAIKAPTRQSRTGKPPCGRCYIFLEHQTHKFRWLSPLALPVTVVTMYFIWPVYERFFGLFNKTLSRLWTGLSFNPTSITPDIIKSNDPNAINTANPYQASAEHVAHMGMIFLGILMGFFLLIYISKGIEWAIYKAKL